MGPEMINDDALMAYLDGEADPERSREIEAALAADPKLRARRNAMAQRDSTVREAFDSLLDRPTPEAMIARIRAAAQAPADNVVSLEARRRTTQRWTWVAGALAAQAAMLAAAVVLVNPIRDTSSAPAPGDYRALSSPSVATPANVMIMFRPDATEAAVRDVLTSVEGRVVGGPNAAGAWLVHVPQGAREAVLPRLRQRSEVKLAEPVDAR